MKSRRLSSLPFSRRLEEHIEVPYTIVGRREWVERCPDPSLTFADVCEVRDSSDLLSVRQWLLDHPVHGLDCETRGKDADDGLDPLSPTSEIVLFQYGTPDRVYVIEPALLPEFKDILESDHWLKIGQNLKFDFKFAFAKYGIHFVRMYDTMLAEQLLTAGLAGVRVSLSELARKYPPFHLISKEQRREFIEGRGLLSREAVEYAVRDVFVLFPIFQAQSKRLKDLKMEVVAKDEFDCIPVTAEMELVGVTLDLKTLAMAAEPFERRADEIQNRVLELYNQELKSKGIRKNVLLPDLPAILDLDSPSQKLEALQNLGFDIKDVQRDTLEELPHEMAKLLAEYSECMKIITTYGERLSERISLHTGRLHPEFHQLGAGDMDARRGRVTKTTIATGRYSGDMQQLPRPSFRLEKVFDPQEEAEVRKKLGTEIQQAQEKQNAA